MSVSPPIRRYSSTGSSSREDLINQYEAEEERIINVLSRKLERVRLFSRPEELADLLAASRGEDSSREHPGS